MDRPSNIPAPTSDTGWSGRKAGRCITDYTRSLTFERELTAEELSALRAWLDGDRCPGNFGVHLRASGATVTATTTLDSSD